MPTNEVPANLVSRLHAALERGDDVVCLNATLPRATAEKVLALLSEERKDGAVVVPARHEFRTSEAAAMLGVSRPHLSRLIKEGRIAARQVGSHWRIPASAVVAFQDAERADAMSRVDGFAAWENEVGLVD